MTKMVLRLTVLFCDSTTAFPDKHYEGSRIQLDNLEPELSTYEM